MAEDHYIHVRSTTRRESDWRRIHVFVEMSGAGHALRGADCWCEPKVARHETAGETIRLFIHEEHEHGSR